MAEKENLKRNWLRLPLILSLAINLLFLGAVAGAWLRHGADGRPPRPEETGGAVFYRELPREARREMRQALSDVFRDLRLARSATADEIGDAIRANPFDPDALNAVIELHAQQIFDSQARIRTVWIAKVQSMTSEERNAYADRVKNALKDHGKRRNGPEPKR